jgi:MFS family permease
LLALFIDGMLYVNVESFFPLYVKDKFNVKTEQISSTKVSAVICALGLSSVIFSKLHSVTIGYFGRKNSILSGLLILFITNFGLGILDYVPAEYPTLFIILNVVLRFIQGYGDSLTFSACYSVIMQTFVTNKQLYISYAEVSFGIGSVVGPILGSVFYSSYGY